MLPLVALAASFIPDLVKLIAGDKAGTVANSVANVVTAVTGTSDPVAAKQKLDTDPAAAAELRAKLAEIAVERTKVENEEKENQRQAELEALRQSIANTQGARTTLTDLVKGGSSIAWGAPLVSLVVTIGFFVFVTVILIRGLNVANDISGQLTGQIINIVVGALTAGFATVVNFWLGSSQSSRNKDDAAVAVQATQATQTSNTIQQLMDVTKHAITAPTVARAAPAPAPAAATIEAPLAVAAVKTPVVDSNFDRCVGITLSQEGGFVDNPHDPGGATNLGITLETLAKFRGKEVTVQDVKDLTRAEAEEIYRANYWLPARCNDLRPGVDLMVFDFGVNAGPITSVKLLQRVVGTTDDGSLGPETMAACKAMDVRKLIEALAEARLAYYRKLPTFADFGRGWTARTAQVKSAALAMVA